MEISILEALLTISNQGKIKCLPVLEMISLCFDKHTNLKLYSEFIVNYINAFI